MKLASVIVTLATLTLTQGTREAEINEEIDYHEETDPLVLHNFEYDDYNVADSSIREHDSPPLSDEKRVTRHLLRKYDLAGVLGRPVFNTTTQLVVLFGVSLIQIIDLDEKGQILTVNVWNTYQWNDSLLMWDPNYFGGVQSIRIPPHRIWTPDIVLFNYADDRLKEQRDALVTVTYDGQVKWMPTAIYKSSCPINIRHFPFDVQNCELKFGSWTFDERRMSIMQLPEHNNAIDQGTYTTSKEWVLVSAPAVLQYRNMSSSAGVRYPFIQYTLKIQRIAVTYTFLLIIPCILLSVLNLVIFWLPPESPAKMMLGIMIFTAFFVLLQLLASLTPPAGEEPPLIGIYFCVNMIMITVSTFIAVFILYLYFRGDRKNQMPEVVRKVMLDTMVRVLCMENMMEKTGKAPPPSSSSSAAAVASSSTPADRQQHLPLIRRPGTSSKDRASGSIPPALANKTVLDLRPIAAEVARQFQATPDKSPMQARGLETDVKEVKRLIRNYVGRLSEKENVARAAKEWRNLSRVIDRIFFFMYLSVIVVSLATIFPTGDD